MRAKHNIICPPALTPLCHPRTQPREEAQTALTDQSSAEAAAKSPGELSQGLGPDIPMDKPAQRQSQGSST